MIDFQSFVGSVHRAVSDAASVMVDKNRELLEHYFEAEIQEDGMEVLVPRTATLTLPDLDENGNRCDRRVQVPLLSLVPASGSQIEKVTFSADFRLSLDNGELNLSFPNEKQPKGTSTLGKLEIVISPTEPAEGVQCLIDAYTELLSKQL